MKRNTATLILLASSTLWGLGADNKTETKPDNTQTIEQLDTDEKVALQRANSGVDAADLARYRANDVLMNTIAAIVKRHGGGQLDRDRDGNIVIKKSVPAKK